MRAWPLENIRDWLIARVAELRQLDPTSVDGREPFSRYGLDSSTLIVLANELSEVTGQPVPLTQIWAHPTPDSLAGWLAGVTELPEDVDVAGVVMQPIAIVGLACRFPGAPDAAAFWELLSTGVDAISEPPVGRWGEAGAPRGGFITDIDAFDPEFFGISPREASHIDPQQRLMLELMKEALDDAGIPARGLVGSGTGVFVGAMWNEYGAAIRTDPALVTEHTLSGGDPGIIPARLSYTLGARGPSLLVNTACSSSLVAVHLAVQSIRAGECDSALVGGVSLMLARDTTHALERLGALAPDGQSKAFDARADGYGRGEGAGLIVLKPLHQALADGNPIYGVIKGSAVNHDGFTNGLTAPSGPAQESLLRNVYRRAGIAPSDVDYVEAHGTGTALGDPIEASALGAVLGVGRALDRRLPIGSVKSVIGHLEPAAGIAGLIKVLLAMRHRMLPASGQFEHANPHIPFAEWGLRVLRRPEVWRGDGRRRLIAGVSAFGFGGTNCHVILESGETTPIHLVSVAAHSADGLRNGARELAASRDPAPPFQRCASAREGSHRLALAVRDRGDLSESAEKFCNGYTGAGITSGIAEADPPRITFLFGGQGSQWTGMGAWLLREPAFRTAINRCEAAFRRHVDWSLIQLLTSTNQNWLERTELAQPALFAMQIALTELWRERGVEPDAVAGMSMGEVAAAHVAGAIAFDDAVSIMCRRSALASTLSGRGAMAVLNLAVTEATDLVSQYEGQLWVAGEAGPNSTVVSGARGAIEAAREELTKLSIGSARIRVDYASHSRYVDPIVPGLRAALADVRPGESRIPFYSSVTGECMDGARLDADHWIRTERDPWYFRTTMSRLLAHDKRIFVEVDPHPILTSVVESNGGLALPTLQRGDRDCSTLLDSLAELYVRGAAHLPAMDRGRPELLVLSARSRESLRASASALARRLGGDDETALSDICYTAAVRRDHHEHRLAVTGSTPDELADALQAVTEGGAPSNAWMGDVPHGERSRVVFVCSGQGSQWAGMGRALLTEPVFRSAIEECDELLQPLTRWSLVAELTAPAGRSRLHETEVAQPALFAIQVAVARLWHSRGVAPDAVIGHSVGEVTAAYLSGALSLAESIEVVYHRSTLMHAAAVTGEGGMASVELPVDRVRELLGEDRGTVCIGAVNDPSSTVVSASGAALADFLAQLRRNGIAARQLRVGYAFHSAQMDQAAHRLSQALDSLTPEPSRLPLYSTVSGKLMAGERFDSNYWARNIRQTVRFAEAMDAAICDGYRVFLDIGPHPVLMENIHRCLAPRDVEGFAIASLRRDEDERSALLRAAGALYSAGCTVDFEELLGTGRVVSLPGYPWQRKRYWLEADHDAVLARAATGHPLLGTGMVSAVEAGTWYWQRALDPAHLPYLVDLTVRGKAVVSAAVIAEMASAAAAQAYGTAAVEITELTFERTLESTVSAPPTTQSVIATGSHDFQLFSRRGPDWVRHARAAVAPDTGPTDEWEKPDTIRARSTAHRSGTDHYRALAAAGLDVGEHLRTVTALWFGAGEVLAELTVPAVSGRTEYRFHPAVLDGGLQALVALCNGRSGSFVVTGIARLRVYRTPPPRVWAYGRSAGSGGDLYLLDEDGRTLVEARGVQLRALPPADSDPIADHFYAVRWRDVPSPEPMPQQEGRWVVFASEDSIGIEIADLLRARNLRCDLVVGPAADSIETLRAALSGPAPVGVVYMGSLGTSHAKVLAEVLIGMGWREQPRLWLITRSARVVGEDTEQVDVDQAALWGLGRTIGLEHPRLSVTRVDLATRPTPDEAVMLVSRMLSDDRETDVALRPRGWSAARLVKLPEVAARAAELRSDGTYVIVCPDSTEGEPFARWMTDRGARHVVILVAAGGRTGPIGLPGVRVMTIGTSDRDHETNSLIADIETAAAPVRGLVHMGDADSAWRWHRHTLGRELELFVLCSSVAAIFGRPGDATDDARIDAIAHHRRGLGRPALSLQFAATETAAHGITDVRTASLPRALDHGLGAEGGRLVLMDLNLRHWFASYPAAAGSPLFDEIETRAVRTRTAFAIELAAAAGPEQVALIEAHLTEQVSLTLQRDPATVSSGATFQAMGMGSLMAVELRNRLESTLGVQLSVALLFTYSTIAALAEFIIGELQAEKSPSPQQVSEPADELSGDDHFELLSDAEAEAMLLESVRLVEQELGND